MNVTKQIIEIVRCYYADGQTELDITAILKYLHQYALKIDIIRNDAYDTDGDFRVRFGKIRYKKEIFILKRKPFDLFCLKEKRDLLKLLHKLEKG